MGVNLTSLQRNRLDFEVQSNRVNWTNKNQLQTNFCYRRCKQFQRIYGDLNDSKYNIWNFLADRYCFFICFGNLGPPWCLLLYLPVAQSIFFASELVRSSFSERVSHVNILAVSCVLFWIKYISVHSSIRWLQSIV